MQYLAAHYWQSARSDKLSMLLQQAYHKRRKMPVVLALMCTDKNIVKRLSEWFYESALPVCSKKGEKGLFMLGACLKRILEKEGNGQEVQITGLFCVGRTVVFFRRGRMQIQILNTRYQRPHSCSLMAETEIEEHIVFQEGSIQPNVGILLATETFDACVSPKMREECLDIGQMRNQRCVKKRLCELGAAGEEMGGRDMGAILLLSR